MKILFDTNVVLDVLLDREPFATVAADLFMRVERRSLDGMLCATTLTTVHYLASRVIGKEKAQEQLIKLMALFEVAPVNRIVLEMALQAGFSDFEDAVLHEAARHIGAQGIVTRDSAGFKKASLPVYSPEELVHALNTLP